MAKVEERRKTTRRRTGQLRLREEGRLACEGAGLRRLRSEEEESGRVRGVSEVNSLKDDEDALWSTRYPARLWIAMKRLTCDHR